MNRPIPPRETVGSALAAEVKGRGIILGAFVALLWFIQIVNTLLGGALVGLGIHPRSIAGLFGILFAPFLHVGFPHLIANTVPLIVLGWLVMARKKSDLLWVSVISGLVGGLGTWLIAPALSVHVGASILIFGYLGYLLSRGFFERRFWPIVGSLVVFVLYGGALFGVLPGTMGVSWQGHLFGLLGGVMAARLLRSPSAPSVDVRPAPRSRIAPPRVMPKELPAHDEEELEAELARMRAVVDAERRR